MLYGDITLTLCGLAMQYASWIWVNIGSCLMAPSHYLNWCWLIISKVQWHSSGDAIWHHGSGSTLVQCLMAPSHYLNQYSFIMSKLQGHSSEGNFTIPQPSITEIKLKITNIKFHSNLLGANELRQLISWDMRPTAWWHQAITWTNVHLIIKCIPWDSPESNFTIGFDDYTDLLWWK